jgi:DNA-binding NarL/FixJ family response regulator
MTTLAKPVPNATERRTGAARPSTAVEPIRLLVVDDHPAVRGALRRVLEEQEDFDVVEILGNPETAVSLAQGRQVDVAVVDYELGARHNGLWLSRSLKRLPHPPKVLLYSAYCDGPRAAASVVAEADGILSKGGAGSQLCHAIRCITRRRLSLPVGPRQMEQIVRERLGDDEQLIFGMLLGGLGPNEIAEVLAYTPAQLESRLASMLGELETVPLRHAGERTSDLRTGRVRPVAWLCGPDAG